MDYDDDDFTDDVYGDNIGDAPLDDQQNFVYDLLGFVDTPGDQAAHDMFWEAMYRDDLTMDERQDIFAALEEYLYDAYGLDFGLVWDWEDFREWYATQ
jgi:hypothetical protein